jgi:hypothetical protein
LVEALILNLEKLGSRPGTESEKKRERRKYEVFQNTSLLLLFASHKTASLIPFSLSHLFVSYHSSLPQVYLI